MWRPEVSVSSFENVRVPQLVPYLRRIRSQPGGGGVEGVAEVVEVDDEVRHGLATRTRACPILCYNLGANQRSNTLKNMIKRQLERATGNCSKIQKYAMGAVIWLFYMGYFTESCYKSFSIFGAPLAMATKNRHLHERNGRYYARVSVPEDVRRQIGKKEFHIPLGPGRREALDALPAAVARCKDQIRKARSQLTRASEEIALTQANLAYIAKNHYLFSIQQDTIERENSILTLNYSDPEVRETQRKRYMDVLRRVVSGDATREEVCAAIGWAVNRMGEKFPSVLEVGSRPWVQASRAIAEAELACVKRQISLDDGVVEYSSVEAKADCALPSVEHGDATRREDPRSSKSLTDILPQFLGERKASASVNYEYKVAIKLFEEYMGCSPRVSEIKRRDLIGFKDLLQSVPTHYGKRFSKKSMKEAMEENSKKKEPFDTLSPTTINVKILGHIHSIFDWLVQNEIVHENPVANVKVAAKKHRRGNEGRQPFTPEDIERIFSGSHFSDPRDLSEDAWAMLIALYSGMRPTELAQMKLTSVREEQGILCFVVEEETKTKSSRRVVPVHPKLVGLGLNELRKRLKESGETHLFPKWYRDGTQSQQKAHRNAVTPDGIVISPLNMHYTRFIPKRFNTTYLKKVGAKVSGKDFYSFRHTFKTALARAGVARAIQDDLCGHDDRSAGARYIHDTSVEAMLKAISRIQYDRFPIENIC